MFWALDQVKGVFLASLNHEIRTPLSGIMGMLDLLLETGIDEDQRDYLNAARLCAESLSELLNSSLEYAALEAGQISLEEIEFSVKEMLEAALALGARTITLLRPKGDWARTQWPGFPSAEALQAVAAGIHDCVVVVGDEKLYDQDKAKSFQQWTYYCLDIGGELASHRYFPPT